MEINIQNQLIILVYSLFLGLIFGAGYDIIRVVSLMLVHFRLKQPIIFLLDVVYMLLVTLSCSLFAYCFNHGILRLYFMIPMGVGFIVYHCTVGRLVMAFSETLIRLIRFVFRITVVKPLTLLLRGIRVAGRWIFFHTAGVLWNRLREQGRIRYTEKQRRRIKNLIRI